MGDAPMSKFTDQGRSLHDGPFRRLRISSGPAAMVRPAMTLQAMGVAMVRVMGGMAIGEGAGALS